LGPERVPAAAAAPASGAEASDAFSTACARFQSTSAPTHTVFPLCGGGGGGARVHLAALGRRGQQGGRCRQALPSAASRHHGGRPATRSPSLSAKGKGNGMEAQASVDFFDGGKMAEPVGFY